MIPPELGELTPRFYSSDSSNASEELVNIGEPAIQTVEWGRGERVKEKWLKRADCLKRKEVLLPRRPIQWAEGRDSFIDAVSGKEKRLRLLLGAAVFSR
jgi:hypothetical protein